MSSSVLQMITKNFEDYPEHRLKFFSLLRAIATHCFPALIRLSSEVCVWSYFVSSINPNVLLGSTCNDSLDWFCYVILEEYSFLWLKYVRKVEKIEGMDR
jgi:hypothetical protein